MSNIIYASGATHIDNHKEVTINGNISNHDINTIISNFLSNDEGGKTKDSQNSNANNYKMFDIHDNQNVHVYNNEPKCKTTTSNKGRSTSTPKVSTKQELQHGVEYPVFSKGIAVTDYHIKALYLDLTKRGWISTQTNEADFKRLFSGKSNDCEIIWTGQDKLGNNEPTPLGISALYVLFKSMYGDNLITTSSKAQKVGPILEKHFVDNDGHFLTNVSNTSKTCAKANEYIKEILELMRKRLSSEDIQRQFEEETESKYDYYDHQDLKYRKRH